MDNQFSNHDALQNDSQVNYQNQAQTPNQFSNQQQSVYQQQSQYQQPQYQQQPPYQQPQYQQPTVVVQTPVYSAEQLQMQEKIRTDQFGLINKRAKLRLEITGYALILIIIITMALFAFLQLMGQGYVSGTSLKHFLSEEIYILNAAYVTAFIVGVLSILMLMRAFFQVQKIRVDSIFPFDFSLKIGVITGSFVIAIVFFLSAFWLMMSLSTYWLLFLFQVIVLISAMIMTFRVVTKAEKIAQVAQGNNIPTVKKPLPESYYYQPVSYKNEVRYFQ